MYVTQMEWNEIGITFQLHLGVQEDAFGWIFAGRVHGPIKEKSHPKMGTGAYRCVYGQRSIITDISFPIPSPL